MNPTIFSFNPFIIWEKNWFIFINIKFILFTIHSYHFFPLIFGENALRNPSLSFFRFTLSQFNISLWRNSIISQRSIIWGKQNWFISTQTLSSLSFNLSVADLQVSSFFFLVFNVIWMVIILFDLRFRILHVLMNIELFSVCDCLI